MQGIWLHVISNDLWYDKSYSAMATAIWQPWISSLPAGPVWQGKEGGPVQEDSRSGRYGGGGLHVRNSWELSIQLERGYAGVKYRQNGGVVLLLNVFVKLSSPACPWQSPDCIPIVGSAKSLVPNDKRFNHTKVWCTFMFIDLQATSCVSSPYTYYNGNC